MGDLDMARTTDREAPRTTPAVSAEELGVLGLLPATSVSSFSSLVTGVDGSGDKC